MTPPATTLAGLATAGTTPSLVGRSDVGCLMRVSGDKASQRECRAAGGRLRQRTVVSSGEVESAVPLIVSDDSSCSLTTRPFRPAPNRVPDAPPDRTCWCCKPAFRRRTRGHAIRVQPTPGQTRRRGSGQRQYPPRSYHPPPTALRPAADPDALRAQASGPKRS